MPIVSDLMTYHADRVLPSASLREAAAVMLETRISSVIVVEQERILGIVTERDVLHAMREGQNPERPILQVMTSPVHTVSASADFREAYRHAARLGIRHLVVVDEQDRPIGVVTETDFRRHMGLGFFRQVNVVDSLMDKAVVMLPPEAPLQVALNEMEQQRISCVVVAVDQQPLGVVTERDVVRLFLGQQDRQLTIGEVMTPEPVSVTVGTHIAEAAELMQSFRFRHLIVKRPDGSVAGVLSEHGLMRLLEIDLVDEAQEEADQMRENLAGLFESLKDVILVVNLAGTILDCNGSVVERLGYREKSLVGMHVADLYPSDVQPEVKRYWQEIFLGQRERYLLPMNRVDGSTIQAECRIVTGHWDARPVMFCIAQDVSERIAHEARQRLAASVFDNAHEGIMITDAKQVILEVNTTFCELTGYSREEAVGQGAGFLRSGHHDETFYRQMWQSIKKTGYWRGEVWNRTKSGEIIVEMLTISTVTTRVGEITHYLGIFSDITQLKEHQKRLEQLAHYDPLTQLPNRMLLSDRLNHAMVQAKRLEVSLAVCYLDLDGFKPVNDEYGHAVGDVLLVEVAQRLRQCVRAGDTAARLGGDEFVLIFTNLKDVHECDRAVSRVLKALSTPFMVANHEITLSASIGGTLFPYDASDADTLMRHADQAMYQAKQSGRNRFHWFDLESDRRTQARRGELGRIQEALHNGEFLLHYQPKVNMREGRVLGAEALIRWQHPERGLLAPALFLPLIEGTEMDIRIGEWVLATAIKQIEAWQAQGVHTQVSVNISGAHLQAVGFVEYLTNLLIEHPHVAPESLELEILETAALEDIARVARIFEACRKLGVRFALDDFGTGYSSLTYFRRLPADMLKIDQSFVRGMLDDPDDLAIVEGVIGLTKAFTRKVIAEGVETPEHGMVLLNLGCDLAQGYGIARPMPAAAFPAWIKEFVSHELWNSVTSFRWSREDMPLLLAEFDMRRWQEAIEAHLADPNQCKPPSTDFSSTRLGRWYFGPAREHYGHIEAFAGLEKLAQKTYQMGRQILLAHDAGLSEVASQDLRGQLGQLTSALSESLQAIQAEVLLSRITKSY